MIGSLNLQIDDIQYFFSNIMSNVCDDNFIIDLNGYSFIDPFFWAVLKCYNFRLKKINKSLKVNMYPDSNAREYFNYLMGYSLSSSTVPMRVINYRKDTDKFTEELVNISKLDFYDNEDKGAFKYLISELINNAIDHGNSFAVACAQRFPRLGEFEIVVCDNGIGFYESLKYSYSLRNVEEALKLSIKKEVTGSKKYGYSDVYKNAGMGLFVISEFIKRINGKMFLISYDTIYTVHDEKIYKLNNPWEGSIVALRFSINEFQNKILNIGWSLFLNILFADYGDEDVF